MKLIISILIITLFLLTSCENNLLYPDTKTTESNGTTAFTFTGSNDDADAETSGILQPLRINNSTFRKYGGSVYMFTGNMAYRYNEHTGALTSLCTDPLCMHNTSECPMYGFSATLCAVYDGAIYFKRTYSEAVYTNGTYSHMDSTSYFCSFDFESGKLRKYYDFGEGGTTLMIANAYTDGKRFYYDMIQNDETKEWTMNWLRLDLDSGKSETLGSFGNNDFPIMQFALDGKLFISSDFNLYTIPSGTVNISEAMEQKQIINETDSMCYGYAYGGDGYIYFASDVVTDDAYQGDIGYISRIKTDGNDITRLTSDKAFTSFFITQKYIYDMDGERIEISKVNPNNPDKNNMESDTFWNMQMTLYRMNHDGSGQEAVFTFPENYYVNRYTFTVYGNYLYAESTNIIYGNDGVSDNGESYVKIVRNESDSGYKRIDLITGKIFNIVTE